MTLGPWVLALSSVMVFTGALAAQQPRPGGPPPNRPELERRVQERFAEVVRTQLGLDQATGQALGEVVRGFQGERQALLRRDAQLRQRLGGPTVRRQEPLPDGEAREILAEMRALRQAEADLYDREQEQLLQILTPGQLVRYYQLRERLAGQIQRLRGVPGGRPAGRPGGPPLGVAVGPFFPAGGAR